MWSLLVLLFWVLVSALVIAAATFFVLYFRFPVHCLRILTRLNFIWNGLHQQQIKLGGKVVSYVEKGKSQPDLVSYIFLHGFSGSSDGWVQVIKYLPPDVHLIAVDLPGHGSSSYQLQGESLSVSGLTDFLHQFLRMIGMSENKLHLIGHSMGGTVSAEYSSICRENITCVSLICPGMRTPEPSEMAKRMRSGGDCPLLPDTPESMQDMMDLNMYNKLKLPKQILKALIEARKPKHDYFHKLFSNIRIDPTFIDQKEWKNIAAPVQLIWGEQDKVVDKSGLEVLNSVLTCPVRVDILPRCGHLVILERPRKLAKLLLEHRRSVLLNT